ncbi:hypothetical protein EI693_06755 [Pseudomonas oryziphila]|uniref:Uncharacterized protein n=1 Tax=Pseudomonas oryziphila TaxID=2894079 RepID=A0ABN5TD08_9PSED|nr:hypothetical protein EI693_06755 [Pseudomonas oryziphila]
MAWADGLILLGAAAQPFRDTRPLLQGPRFPCRSGLVSRKGCAAPPATPRHVRWIGLQSIPAQIHCLA